MGLIFGIYPGRTSVEPSDLPEQPVFIQNALSYLKKGQKLFLVRGYLHYTDSHTIESELPHNMLQYVNDEIKLDLVLCYRSKTGNVANWNNFIRRIIQQYGTGLAKIQITEEPNNPDPSTGGDGSSPNVIDAILAGVIAAKEEIIRLGFNIEVGFNAVVSFSPADLLWTSLAEKSTDLFRDSLDYVGLDFFPDVFRPLPTKPDGNSLTIEEATIAVIGHFRNVNLSQAKIPAIIPIHITENGWATSPNRTYERQEQVLVKTLSTVINISKEMNITHYEYFALRDADSSSNALQFGLLKDDYAAKPSFNTFRRLIQEYGQ